MFKEFGRPKNEQLMLGLEAPRDPDYLYMPEMNRRNFLKGAGLIGIAVATSGILANLDKFSLPKEPVNPEKNEVKTKPMVFGEVETFPQTEMVGVLNWIPDGPITYWTTAENKRRYLVTGGNNNATYMLETDGNKTLKDIMLAGGLSKNDFKEVYSPDENIDFRKHYVGITSVLQLDKENPDHLLGVVHCEQRVDRNASATFTATIGLVESMDAGSTWQDKGPLIVGEDVKEPGGDKVSGAGQPSAIYNEKDGYVYILYIDWAAGKNIKHADQIYLARAKGNDNGSLGEIEYLNENGFSSFEPGKLKPVIPVPQDSDLVYTALPNVSWNTELKQYICMGECDTGFWLAKSKDLIEWTEPQIVYDFSEPRLVIDPDKPKDPNPLQAGRPHSILQVGEKWDSYPTALDESKPNSQITGKTGIFYHSSGDNVISHEPAMLDFTIVS